MRGLPRFFGLALLGAVVNAAACQAQPKVIIATREGRDVTFAVEIADTPARRELGLQYRHELPTDRGMIFLFPGESDHSFWMKNTFIPLDMIFINRDHKIVGIVEQAVPFSTHARVVSAPSLYVLEINGGLSRRYGFRAGDTVRFEGVSKEPARE